MDKLTTIDKTNIESFTTTTLVNGRVMIHVDVSTLKDKRQIDVINNKVCERMGISIMDNPATISNNYIVKEITPIMGKRVLIWLYGTKFGGSKNGHVVMQIFDDKHKYPVTHSTICTHIPDAFEAYEEAERHYNRTQNEVKHSRIVEMAMNIMDRKFHEWWQV